MENSTKELVLHIVETAGIIEGAGVVSALPHRAQSTVRGYMKELIDGGYLARGYIRTAKPWNGTLNLTRLPYAPALRAAFYVAGGAGL